MLGATVYETLDNVSAVNDATAYDLRWIANENGGYDNITVVIIM